MAVLVGITRLAHAGIHWVEEAYPAAAAIQMKHGLWPYRDFFFDKPPLPALLYRATGITQGVELRILGALFVMWCAWLMADLSAAHVRKVKNADGDYIWTPSVIPGQPDTILGKPVFIDPFVPAKGTANKWILFGDMSAYFVRFAGGIRFERSDEYAFNTDLVTFRCLLRGDGALVDLTGAVKAFRGGTA